MEILRDTAVGQIIRFATKNKYLQYPDEQDDFQPPTQYIPYAEPKVVDSEDSTASETSTQVATPSSIDKEVVDPVQGHHILTTTATRPDVEGESARRSSSIDREFSRIGSRAELSRAGTQADVEQAYGDAIRQETLKTQQSRPIVPQKTQDGRILVDWYTTDDKENPQNWTRSKKIIVVLQIYIYTLAVYIGSAIYTPGIPQVVEIFGVTPTVASLGLSIYVAGYGLGPLLFSPLSEIPVIGRNPPYMITFGIYLLLSLGAALVNNFPGFIVLRFLQGFFGSPALATGGATIGDLFNLIEMPYYLTFWAAFATAGPALGPIISGFSVPKTSWHWSQWEILWLAAPTFISMMFLLPETSAQNILLRRANRLRKRTGNSNLVSQSEIDQSKMNVSEIVVENLWRPVQINLLDPAVAFTSIYIALLYGIFYSFFESFPLVYGQGLRTGAHQTIGYGMNIGVQGLVFLSISVGVIIAIAIYVIYLRFWFNPRLIKNGLGAPEERLVPGLLASLIAPIGLFIFAWTGAAAPRIHWIVPTLGITIFVIPVFILFQVIFIYIPLTYPQYAASLFAGNDAVRSSVAAGAIHFAYPLLHNLGVGRGVSLLGGLTFIGVIGIWVLYFGGAWLRGKSRFAAK